MVSILTNVSNKDNNLGDILETSEWTFIYLFIMHHNSSYNGQQQQQKGMHGNIFKQNTNLKQATARSWVFFVLGLLLFFLGGGGESNHTKQPKLWIHLNCSMKRTTATMCH